MSNDGQASGRFWGKAILFWITSVLFFSVFFFLLSRGAPQILKREQDLGHWEHYAQAVRLLERNQTQKFVVDRKQRLDWLDQAIAHLDKALAARPESADYLWLHALALTDRGRMDTPPNPEFIDPAIGELRRAWEESDQRWEKPGLLLAGVLIDTASYEEGRKILIRLVAIYPERPDAYDVFWKLETTRGRKKVAIDVLELKKEESIFTQEDWRRLSRLLIETNAFEKAQATLEEAIRRGWDTAESRYLLGLAAIGNRDNQTARKALDAFMRTETGKGDWPTPSELGLTEFPSRLFPTLGYLYLRMAEIPPEESR